MSAPARSADGDRVGVPVPRPLAGGRRRDRDAAIVAVTCAQNALQRVEPALAGHLEGVRPAEVDGGQLDAARGEHADGVAYVGVSSPSQTASWMAW